MSSLFLFNVAVWFGTIHDRKMTGKRGLFSTVLVRFGHDPFVVLMVEPSKLYTLNM